MHRLVPAAHHRPPSNDRDFFMTRSLRARRLALGLATLILAGSAARPALGQGTLREHLDPTRLAPARDSFAVHLRGQVQGWQRLVRIKRADGWQLEDAVHLEKIATQSSVMRFSTALDEQSLRQEGMMEERPMRIALDFTTGRVSGTSDTPSNTTGSPLRIDTTLAPGIVDDNAMLSLLVAVRWREGLTFSTPMLTSGKGTIEPCRLAVLASDSVTVPAGTFDTWRVEMRMGRSTTLVDVTRQAPYRIVRIRNGPAFEMLLLP
jgi:hypothetical protein